MVLILKEKLLAMREKKIFVSCDAKAGINYLSLNLEVIFIVNIVILIVLKSILIVHNALLVIGDIQLVLSTTFKMTFSCNVLLFLM